jgi:mono/diheme cytochrome c family protein
MLTFVLLVACERMRQQDRIDPFEPASSTAGLVPLRAADDPPVERTSTELPAFSGVVDEGILRAGEESFRVACAPCHGLEGRGDGRIVERGFPAPPSLHEPRLRAVPDAYLYVVIVHGLGRMLSAGDRLRTDRERLALIAWIRALQAREAPPPSLRGTSPSARKEEGTSAGTSPSEAGEGP